MSSGDWINTHKRYYFTLIRTRACRPVKRAAKPLFGGSNPPVASISTQTEEAPVKSGAFSRLTAILTATEMNTAGRRAEIPTVSETDN